MLRLLETFLKSAPQLVLQLCIMVQQGHVEPLQGQYYSRAYTAPYTTPIMVPPFYSSHIQSSINRLLYSSWCKHYIFDYTLQQIMLCANTSV